MKTWVLSSLAVVVVLTAAASLLHRPVPLDEVAPTDQYDQHFRKYNKRYFGVLVDWRWFKAQSMVESSLRRNVRSDQGAVGVMQLLPGTFNEILEPYSIDYSISDPRWNIASGIAFNRYLFDRWRENLSPAQSLKFAFASYNAGFSRMLRVASRSGEEGAGPTRWSQVAPHAPGETRRYVEKIHDLMGYDL